MRISRITIENFRSFAQLDVELTGNAVIVGENKIGKSYFGRIYFRGVLVRGRRGNRQTLLDDAEAVINSAIARLKSRKTAQEQRAYFENLPKKWAQGLRRIASSRGKAPIAVWFLGDPIRLPRPLSKIGRRIPPGFSMTLASRS
jgi:predicted ATPase